MSRSMRVRDEFVAILAAIVVVVVVGGLVVLNGIQCAILESVSLTPAMRLGAQVNVIERAKQHGVEVPAFEREVDDRVGTYLRTTVR